MESVLEVPDFIIILTIVASVTPIAFHAYSMGTIRKRIVERELKLDSGPLTSIAIIGTFLIFLGFSELCIAHYFTVKYNSAFRTNIATILKAFNLFLVFVIDIGNQAPHIVKLAYSYAIYAEIDITSKVGIVAIVVVHP